jgi:hypothetical protein
MGADLLLPSQQLQALHPACTQCTYNMYVHDNQHWYVHAKEFQLHPCLPGMLHTGYQCCC